MYILRKIAKFVGGQYTGQIHPRKIKSGINDGHFKALDILLHSQPIRNAILLLPLQY